ncbi:MAG: hypothetical protein QOE07_1283 [Acidimicrobiaceae bacterium]|nr:hypothetical protein [Acidimicrobiaceae bacterium]
MVTATVLLDVNPPAGRTAPEVLADAGGSAPGGHDGSRTAEGRTARWWVAGERLDLLTHLKIRSLSRFSLAQLGFQAGSRPLRATTVSSSGTSSGTASGALYAFSRISWVNSEKKPTTASSAVSSQA